MLCQLFHYYDSPLITAPMDGTHSSLDTAPCDQFSVLRRPEQLEQYLSTP